LEYTVKGKLADALFVVSLASVSRIRSVTGPKYPAEGALAMIPVVGTETHASFVPVGSFVQM
jgi:hypothetical protein